VSATRTVGLTGGADSTDRCPLRGPAQFRPALIYCFTPIQASLKRRGFRAADRSPAFKDRATFIAPLRGDLAA